MDTPTGLTNQMKGAEKIAVTIDGPRDAVVDKITRVQGVLSVKPEDGANGGPCNYIVECKLQTDLRGVLAKEIVSQGWGLLELRGVSMSLEDVFINLVTQE
jgi:ABC-2 type transport system ATP-binding protein